MVIFSFEDSKIASNIKFYRRQNEQFGNDDHSEAGLRLKVYYNGVIEKFALLKCKKQF